ncbi:hypothetical protein [Methylocapsa aurea]|jgi:hypothetical protein
MLQAAITEGIESAAAQPFDTIAEGHVSILRLLGGRQDRVSIRKAADL